MRYLARIGGKEITVEVMRRGRGRYRVCLGQAEHIVERRAGAGGVLGASIDGREVEALVVRDDRQQARRDEDQAYTVCIGGREYPVRLADPLRRPPSSAEPRQEGRIKVRSIMPGKIAALLVQEGQEVRAGQGLLVVEAMKMENEITSPKDGRVTEMKVGRGETVEAGAVLLVVE